MFSIIADGLTSIAAIVVAITAIWGLTTWRREHIGRRRIDLAEEVLALFYEAKDAIRSIRDPFSWSSEGTSRKPDEHESADEKIRRDQAFIPLERCQKYQAVFNRLRALRYRFVAQNGSQSDKPFNDLRQIWNTIVIESQELISLPYDDEGMDASEKQQDHETRKTHLATIHAGRKRSDEIAAEVDRIVAEIEAICRPIIQGASKL